MQRALSVGLSGEMSQASLDRLQELLRLRREGRLDDPFDDGFGRQWLQADKPNRLVLQLSRQSPGEWSVDLSYESQPPAEDVVERWRSDIEAAASSVGLTVDKVWVAGRR